MHAVPEAANPSSLRGNVAEIATEEQTIAAQTAQQVKALQSTNSLSIEATTAARTIETNLERLAAPGSENISIVARRQAMTETETALRTLRSEVPASGESAGSLRSIEDNIIKLHTTNDAIIAHRTENAVPNITTDLRGALQDLNASDRVAAEAASRSLNLVSAPEITPSARRAAIDDLSSNLEKLRTTADPTKLTAIEEKVAELRAG